MMATTDALEEALRWRMYAVLNDQAAERVDEHTLRFRMIGTARAFISKWTGSRRKAETDSVFSSGSSDFENSASPWKYNRAPPPPSSSKTTRPTIANFTGFPSGYRGSPPAPPRESAALRSHTWT